MELRVPWSTLAIASLDEPLATSTFDDRFKVTQFLTPTNTYLKLQDLIAGPEHVEYIPHNPAQHGSLSDEVQLPGTLWTASVNGTVYSVRLSATGEIEEGHLREEVYAGPGRVLGFSHGPDGSMYLCNALQV
jgi:hypothetical protein